MRRDFIGGVQFMKRIIALSVILGILFIGSAFGAVQETAKFSVDVPEGWTFTPQGDDVAYVVKNGTTVSLGIFLGSLDGLTTEEYSRGVMQQLGGSNLEVDDDGDCQFDYLVKATQWYSEEKTARSCSWGFTGMDEAEDEFSEI